jgi:hypothetical protein
MSLHIGRLSPDVQQSHLEHLFQKYGCCVVNLKDGYGFAVYDSNADAARALRALQGRYVCGGRITVNWSKQQPRFSQGFRRSSRFAEYSHRTSRDGGGNIRFRDSLAEKNQPASHDEGHDKNHAASHDECHDPASALEKECDKSVGGVHAAGENIGGREASPGEGKRDEGGTVDASAIEHERWVEAGKVTPGDGAEFDFYEPYHGLDRQEETENVIKRSSWDSHNHRRSAEKWQGHPDKCVDLSHDDKSRSPTCYTCGVSGHIARYCPQEMDAGFKARRDGLNFREKLELRQRRFGSPSRRRPEYHVHPMDQKRHRDQDGRKPFSDIKKRVSGLSNVHRESRRHDHNSENVRQAMKETHKRHRSDRSRGSSLSSEHSKHSRHDNIRELKSYRTSSDSRCRSLHSRFRVHSPSYSAHSSSKSSQPTQPGGSRSNINHPVPFLTAAPPQHKSSSDVENKNPDGLMKSHLEDNSGFRMTPEIKHINTKQEGKGSALNSEVPTTSNVDALSNGECLVPDKGANVAGYAGGNLDKILADYNDNVASGVQSQNANQSMLVKNGRSKSLKLTTNEVISALKHYRMETHEVDSLDQPVEKYLGAARLWPWEIVYYRRLKKGSISTENYAKRLEQNKEFGIVDQYVRSSSGWWECQ